MTLQVQDDFALLDLMNEDMELAPVLYKPTNYWEYKANFLLPALKEEGLKDFRRKTISVFASIGGVDVLPKWFIDLHKSRLFNNRVLRALPFWAKTLDSMNGLIKLASAVVPGYRDYLKKKPYRYAQQVQKETGAAPIEGFEASLAGNPEYVFQVKGKYYTNNIFDYYLRYAYCCKFIDFEKIKVIVELGSGSGKLTEVVKKLHPHITFLQFDISPQLYVGERYLSTVFPDDVVSYKQNRSLDALPELEKGKIYFLGSWQFPMIEKFRFDLFFNLTSFQEMEPFVVANYLKFVNGNADFVYLHSKMDGKEVAAKEGEFGVMEPTKLIHFEQGLADYVRKDIQASRKETGELKWKGHMDSFWVKK
jgi:putative sugar O-methyltransferase